MKALRGFLVLLGYYRRFINGYGIIARPLTDLLKKETFKWSSEAEIAFQKLKEVVSSLPALPNFNLEILIEADACSVGVGAVLMQQGEQSFGAKTLFSICI